MPIFRSQHSGFFHIVSIFSPNISKNLNVEPVRRVRSKGAGLNEQLNEWNEGSELTQRCVGKVEKDKKEKKMSVKNVFFFFSFFFLLQVREFETSKNIIKA